MLRNFPKAVLLLAVEFRPDQLMRRLEWTRVFSALESAVGTSLPNRSQRLALARLRLMVAEPLLTSVLGHPPSIYHLARATGDSVSRIYRLLNIPTGAPSQLSQALGLQKVTLSQAGLAKTTHGGLVFPVEKLVGVRRMQNREQGPLCLYRMTRYPKTLVPPSSSEVPVVRESVVQILPWLASVLRVMEDRNQVQMLGEFLGLIGRGVVSVGQKRWGLDWPNDQLARFLSFQWFMDEAPFDPDTISAASQQVADKIRKMPLEEFAENYLSWSPLGMLRELNQHKATLWCFVCGGRTTVRPRADADTLTCRYCGQAYRKPA
jgi:hypothetical protein